MRRFLFYFLSFTWGLPLTLIGCVVAAALILFGQRPTRYGYCLLFSVGSNWGGVNLGPVILTQHDEWSGIKAHEHGHAIQNTVFGPFMLFLVCVPSVTRYWYREIVQRIKPHKALPNYDSVWFEAQATQWGNTFIEKGEI